MTVVFVAKLPNLLYYSKMNIWIVKAETDSFIPTNDGLEITALGTQHLQISIEFWLSAKPVTSLWFWSLTTW